MSLDVMAYLEGFAFCTIRPAVALFLVPFGYNSSLGVALRVPLMLAFAALPAQVGWPPAPVLAALVEIGLGVAMGLMLGTIVHVAAAAGALLDQQGGYSIATTFNPNFAQEAALLEVLFAQFAALTLFTGPGLRLLFGFFADMWALWPAGHASPDFTAMFRALAETSLPGLAGDALRLAAPLIGLLLLIDVALGLMSRHVRQLNPFAEARTVKAMVLAFALMLSIAPVMAWIEAALHRIVRMP
jgi:type III secretion protein T